MTGRKEEARSASTTLWQLERIGGVSLSPDGAQAVCSVSSYSMADNKSAASLWLLSTFGGEPRRLTSCGEKDGQPALVADRRPRSPSSPSASSRAQKDDDVAALPDPGRRRRGAPRQPLRARRRGVQVVSRRPAHRVRLVGLARAAAAPRRRPRRHKEWSERKETGYATSEAQYRYWDRNLPMGRVAHLHVLDVASGRITDLFEGTRARADAQATPTRTRSTSRRTAATSPSPTTRRRRSASTTARRSPRSTCAAAKVETLALRHGLGLRRAALLAGRPADRIRRLAASAASTRCRRNAALLRRGGSWTVLTGAWDHSVDTPLRWSARRQRALLHRRGPRAPPSLPLRDREPRPRRSSRRAAGCRGSTSPATSSRRSPTRWTIRRACTSSAANEAPRRLERFNDELLATLRLAERRGASSSKGAGGDAGADVGRSTRRASTRRRSTRSCTASTAARTRRPATPSTTAGTTRSSRRRATSSPASTTTARAASATPSSTASRTAGASSSWPTSRPAPTGC